MQKKNQRVEQIIVITDEGENSSPRFVEAMKDYRQTLMTDPNVVIVRTPGGRGA